MAQAGAPGCAPGGTLALSASRRERLHQILHHVGADLLAHVAPTRVEKR